ncbi:MAG: sugar ABC transporter ATP-binding protein [Planctomycetota bacterium]|jgi:ribose transport system ATP-binding protein|nr:sugar ABC transporter ATP-binding protein [Planctomycetota bacterium]
MQEDVLEISGVSKRFGGIQALDNVHFSLARGEIHALLGENGAGKSTLMNIVSGIYPQDSGSIALNGETVDLRTPLSAKRRGIIKVHQELQLVPEMSVAQNIFLGNELVSRFGRVDFETMVARADEMLKSLEAEFSARIVTRRLSTAQMQMVEIAKALLNRFTVLILDEPTASLTMRETEQLFKTMRSLRANGKSIIYISHRLDEIFEVCDRVTVLRDGKYVGAADVAAMTKDGLIRMMTQRDISHERFNATSNATDEIVLSAKGYSDGRHFHDVDFDLHRGEILGFSGLVGAGRTELMRAVIGVDGKVAGELFVHGVRVTINSPKDAKRAGIMLVPEDRKLQGFVAGMTNYQNVSLSNLRKFAKCRLLDFRKRDRAVDGITRALNVQPDDNILQTSRLSGGNQQKVVLSKAVNAAPEILILDEPTRGIDVNAKNEIYLLMKKLASEGKSIIMISSELPEILSLSDRIVVMYEGRVTGVLHGSDATEEDVIRRAIGGETT